MTELSNRLPRVLLAHAGKQHAYRQALALQQLGCLSRFVTSSYYKPSVFPDRLLSRWNRADTSLRRRWQAGLDEHKVCRDWTLEIPELLARRVLGDGGLAENLVFHRDARFDRQVRRRQLDKAKKFNERVYWGFQGSCYESLRKARSLGLLAVAEFATAHVTRAVRLLRREQQRHPQWADSISNLRFPDWYRRRLEQEPLRADLCVVASRFSQESLEEVGVAQEKIVRLPLGADLDRFVAVPRTTEGPFRILFVGGIGQRKGIHYLLQAFDQIRGPGLELILIGPLMGQGKALKPYLDRVTYLGRQDQKQVAQWMAKSQVLVLPSVFEGFGLVLAEAMASGLPIIASTHTIGPEIVTPGENGFLIEPDDVEALAQHLQWMAQHRQQVAQMGQAAAQIGPRLSWERHRETLAEILKAVF